jgi:hypothetical protein
LLSWEKTYVPQSFGPFRLHGRSCRRGGTGTSKILGAVRPLPTGQIETQIRLLSLLFISTCAVKLAQLLYENPNPSMHAMAPPKTPTFFGYAFLFLFAAKAVAPASTAALSESETCVPSLQRMLSCLDFIEHRSDEIPAPCCVQVRAAVAEQPCCMMHVVRGNAGKLIGPEYDKHRAMVDVTAKCFGDASVLLGVIRNCSGFHRHR